MSLVHIVTGGLALVCLVFYMIKRRARLRSEEN
jgi:hypothetical protein